MPRPTPEEMAAAHAWENERRPAALVFTQQYERGYITLWELIEQLTVVAA